MGGAETVAAMSLMSSKLACLLHGLLALYFLAGQKNRWAGAAILGLSFAQLFFPQSLLPALFLGEAALLWQMWRRGQPNWLECGLLLLWSCLFKVALIHSWIHPGTERLHYKAWLWTIINAMGIWSVCLLVGRKHWSKLLLLCLSLVALTAWCDLVYARYFDEVPGFYLITQVSQAGVAFDAASSLIRPIDIALFLDLLIALAILLRSGPAIPVPGWVHKCAWGCGLLALGMTLYPRANLVTLPGFQAGADGRNIWLFKATGLLNYHLVDFRQFSLAHIRKLLNLPDPDGGRELFDWKLWNQWIEQSRNSIGQDTVHKGRYSGCNLIYVQLESLQFFGLTAEIGGKPVMPYTQKFLKDCLWGGLVDQTGIGRSADGEFIAINSLVPCFGWPVNYSYPSNTYRGLPQALAAMGYTTCYTIDVASNYANSDVLSTSNGFQKKFFQDQLGRHAAEDRLGGTGLSDKVYFERLQPILAQQPSPFYFHVITNSGHYPYREVTPSEYQLPVPEGMKGSLLHGFLESCARRDQHLQEILENFRKSPLWKNSLFCFYGDHDSAVPDPEVAAFLQQEPTLANKVLNDRVAFFLHCPDEKLKGRIEWDRPAQSDMVPTLAHLLGVDPQKLNTTGRNLLASGQSDYFVLSQGGEGYSLSDRHVYVRTKNQWRAFQRPGQKEVTTDLQTTTQIEHALKVIQDSFRLNVQSPTGKAGPQSSH